MTIKIVVFVLCVIAFTGNDSRQFRIPSFIKLCKRNDPNINECLKKIFETLRPFAGRGMPEMQILPLDPMIVPSVTLNQGSGSMNFAALFTDLKGYGAKNYQVQKIKADLKKKNMEIDLHFPSFKIESRYEVNGQILLLPIKGNGNFVGNFSNVQAKVKIGLEYIEKNNNKTFIEIKEHKVSLIIGAVKLHFDNLFNGNKELGNQTNWFINENWRDLIQEIKPLLEDTVATIVMGIFKPLLENFSMNDMFPV